MSRLINLTEKSNMIGTSHKTHILFGNDMLAINYDERYSKEDMLKVTLKSTADMNLTVLFTANNKSLDFFQGAQQLSLKKDKCFTIEYSLHSVETDFHLDFTVNYELSKSFSWFYDSQYMTFYYLRNELKVRTRPRGGSLTLFNEDDEEFDPFSKKADELLNQYSNEFKLLQSTYPDEAKLDIPANDQKKLQEINECWRECLRQEEEEAMHLYSPMDTIKHMLGVDDNFELLDNVPTHTQFEMDLS